MFPDFFNRISNTGRIAWAAWNGQALIPTQQAGWEINSARMFRYELYNNYYSNNIYGLTDRFALIQKSAYGLNKNIRPIMNPIYRLVELYVSKVYGGSIDMQTLSTGAIPFVLDDDRIREALKRAIIWSNFGNQKSLYVRMGALYGDVALKIIDEREEQRVRIEVLDPRKIKHAVFNNIGEVKEIHIEYYMVEESDTPTAASIPSRKMYLYTEIITPDSFRTFKNGNLFAYYNDENGKPTAEWANEYGKVPVVMAQHRNIGLNFGMNAFQPSLRKIDEVNDLDSMLNDSVRKHVNPIWFFAGTKSTGNLDVNTETRDQFPALYGPQGSTAYPMVAPMDIAAATAQAEHLLQEIERDMPELALHRLREKGLATAPGVRASYSDAIDRIVEARGNYDDSLIRAFKMLLGIGGLNRYPGFEGFSIDSADGMDIYIKARPVIEDELPKQDRLAALLQSSAPSSAIWSELGIDEATINEWEAERAKQMPTQSGQQIDTRAIVDGALLPAGTGTRVVNEPAVRGAKLPAGQARKVAPITADELAAVAALHRKGTGK